MSLTRQVEDPKSPLGAFMRERFPFPKVRAVLAEIHEALAGKRALVDGDVPSWALGLIGHAVDYRIRYHFRNLGDEDLVLAMQGAWNVTAGPYAFEAESVDAERIPEAVTLALKADPRGSVSHGAFEYRRRRDLIERTSWGPEIAYLNHVQPQLARYLPTDCTIDFFDWLADETKEIAAHRREPTIEQEWALAEYCLVLGLFESQWRTGFRRWPPPIFKDAWPSSVEELLDAVPGAWVSITMDVHFCVEALEEAIALYGAPEIMNTDQGSQFTSQTFTGLLKEHGIRISMDGKGAWRDNVFIERLWRSVKYEEVYLHAYETVSDSRTGLGRYFDLYNRRRPHSSLKRKTPDQVYFSQQPLTLAA